jgi:LmbE family N-acetylglucosaminyl deacetylase
MKRTFTLLLTATSLSMAGPNPLQAQDDVGPKVLIVTAHPDDEAMFASTVYKITHELDGRVDLALVTDGAGGYRYATLAEPIYGMDLTDPDVASEYLPAIRKQELMSGGEIVGIRNYFFIDQPDQGRSDDVQEFFDGTWDTTFVKQRLHETMVKGDYDFVFAHLPVDIMHAHHKVSTMLALEVATALDDEVRPAVLGGWFISREDTTEFEFDELEGYPITRVSQDVGPFSFDRNQPIGLNGRLNYKIVANWLIAEHRSQGTMQNFLGQSIDEELFFYFDANDGAGADETVRLFERLQIPRADDSQDG